MPEKLPTLLPDGEPKRDRLRALLTIACVVAVVLAGSVVPAVSGGGLGRTPLGSVVPQHDVNVYGPPQGAETSTGSGTVDGGGGLGALNPGDRTSVGGSLAGEDSAFRSQETSVHFTVQSTARAYWRTGAYDTYTGSGWERTGDRRAYDGSVEGDGLRDREVEYRVRLNRSATALPSVWRPASLSGADLPEESLFVTDRRAFATDGPVPAGTTYSGVSHRAPRDPDVLRAAGGDYPDDLERRYTSLPGGSDRLAGFTAELTADADSAYDAAARIETWLESNKNYSLDAPEPDGDVASEFVFEMDAGYCEYFATAMAAMLRSQGVPARYAVGYSTGQQVGANTYEVRGMNAHAWVEVYFPDVGWVKFDPTPGSERLGAEQESLANETEADAGDYEPTEPGSPGEQLSPNESTDLPNESAPPSESAPPTGTGSPPATADGAGGESGTQTGLPDDAETPSADGTSDGTPPTDGDSTANPDAPTTGDPDSESDASGSETTATGESRTTTAPDEDSSDDESDEESASDGGYDVELNRTPVPGATVEVSVSEAETPASGVTVLFNGERVGTTGEDGTVTAQVPYVRNLTVSVEDGGGEGAASVADGEGAADAADGEGTANAADGGDAIGPEVAGPPPGFDAPMSLSSAPLGPLAVDGRTLQSGAPGNGTRANGTEYELATDASLTVSGDVAVGSEVVVTATVEDVPVRNGAVLLAGEQVGTTDRSGRAEVRLPESPGNATLSVERGPVTGETTVEIPRLNVSVEPALPLALPGTSLNVSATYGGEPVSDARVAVAGANATTGFDGSATATLPLRDSADVVVSARGQTRRTTVSGLLVNLAAALGGAALVLGGLGYGASRRGYGPRRLAALLVAGARALPGFAIALLFGAVDRLERAAARALAALRELRDGESTVRELLARFRAWSRELAVRLRAWLRERVRAARASATGGAADGTAGTRAGRAPDASDRDEDSYRTLREAWADFLGVVSVRDPESATPGELAAHAVREDDLPSGAVLTLRDAFRDVEYGARSPADRLPRVERAVETIERAAREGADESADGEDSELPGGEDDAEQDDPAPLDAPDEATPPGGDD